MSDIASTPLASRSQATKPGASAVILWTASAGIVTIGLTALRDTLDKSHIALAYLLVVLIGTSRLGRRGGIALAVGCFFAFNFFLLPPYHTLVVADPRDWLVLLAFLLTSLVAAQLLHRAQAEAAAARTRTLEIDRLSTLGAETLSAGRAEEAVAAIAHVIQTTLGLSRCEVFLADGNPPGFRLVADSNEDGQQASGDADTTRFFDYLAQNSAVGVERLDSTVHVIAGHQSAEDATWTQRDAKAVAIPLNVRGRAVGIMRVTGKPQVFLDPEQRRFAQALAYYAALGLERVRLTAEAERSEALRAASRLKDAFVAAVSHDLRTPLTTIKAVAHELAEADDRVRIIEAEADRLNQFVEDVLDLSKLNAGQAEMKLEVNTVEDLIGAALARVQGLPRSRAVKVEIPEGNVIVATFDFVQSLRCLVNLLENALKYSPPGSQVEVRVANESGGVSIAVLDRGPGIDKIDAHRIFEPFVRINDKHTTGAGLGLAIARRIAVAQGGDVRYTPRDGGGSVFTLVLPAGNAPAS